MQTKTFSRVITPRLIIRPITMDDADNYFAAEQASLNELIPHWTWAKTDKSVDDIKKFINETVEDHKKEYPSEMNFALISKESNQFLGMIWFYGINWNVPSFEIHYWLDTRCTGNGYMTEAVGALTQVCLDLFKAKRVQICLSSENEKSRKVVEKLNFKLEGKLENYFVNFETNKISDGLLFSCCHPSNLPSLDIHVDRG